jgi:hypothetical protein
MRRETLTSERAIHAVWWIAELKLTKVTLAAGCKGSLSPGRLSPPQNKSNDQKFLNLWQPVEPPRVCHNTRPFRKITAHEPYSAQVKATDHKMLPPQKCGMPRVGQSLIQAILNWAILKPNIPPPSNKLPGMGQV